jgi:Carboxypeptidase regulatory-like domain
MRKLAVFFCLAFLLTAAATFAKPQDNKHEAQLRTVRGFVVNKTDSPIASAIVYLKNLRTNQIRSYISERDGRYRFSGLDPNADYEIHAEKDGAKSTTKTVSSFDSRKEIVLTLKIETNKN